MRETVFRIYVDANALNDAVKPICAKLGFQYAVLVGIIAVAHVYSQRMISLSLGSFIAQPVKTVLVVRNLILNLLKTVDQIFGSQ